MSDKKNPLGPTGETVRRNVVRLRGSMQYKELAERLAELGRPIPALGLRRIEAGERRVDADDLVALAVAFGVSPLTLLMPADGSYEIATPMTGVSGREVAHNTQWLWGLGREPLEVPGFGDNSYARRVVREFQIRSVPDVEPRSTSVSQWRFDVDDPEKTGAALGRLMETQGMVWEAEGLTQEDWEKVVSESKDSPIPADGEIQRPPVWG